MLSRTGSDAMLTRYVDKLDTLIQQLPASAISLHNAYYVHAALIYSQANQFEKAYQCDRKTLEAIRQLENNIKTAGGISATMTLLAMSSISGYCQTTQN